MKLGVTGIEKKGTTDRGRGSERERSSFPPRLPPPCGGGAIYRMDRKYMSKVATTHTRVLLAL